MARTSIPTSLTITLGAAALMIFALTTNLSAQVAYLNQGWTPTERNEFYSLDQGARIVPFDWVKALKHADDGTSFLADGFSRYGYLPNPASPTAGLPVGFLSAPYEKENWLSMTCSACHTRQIEIDGVATRIDGGPALVDFQSLFDDLDMAFDKVLHDDADFAAFADAALGASSSEAARKELKQRVEKWFEPYHTIFQRALHPRPDEEARPLGLAWGLGRADAVSMIFNRVAGLDIGTAPNHMIPENIKPADAPVRYPFVWNAAKQYMTQWPGFAKNGDDILGLARNVGEVYGVFGMFQPEKIPLVDDVRYLKGSSLNFPGLMRLETLIKKLEPPKWPGKLDPTLVEEGEKIYQKACGANCHEIDTKVKPPRLCNPTDTWKTPVQDVKTDAAEYQVLGRTAKTGVLEGQLIPLPPFTRTLKADNEPIINILSTAVVQSILRAPLHFKDPFLFDPIVQECLKNRSADPSVTIDALRENILQVMKESLQALYREPKTPPPPPAYESRVMKGIWAAAPYLHNGSVPTLADLLKPPAQRPASFKVGTAYDMENVGLAKGQPKLSFVYETTAECGGSKRDASGNSRCGHDFGTNLKAKEVKALLEYLKSL
ncbi:di-heme-cytochrome C peroxidase [Methylocystis sp. ATCC 49242]|uniref:di-heme-cytochrome C peroxidase n=1 Tax=Methylocystis sp. ATCC 49242 TaxID=622637 RepID=UPI0001F87A00|nr:di-heme-cytochrome C peroxidase [Methylocystis sp. ATCC 49242]